MFTNLVLILPPENIKPESSSSTLQTTSRCHVKIALSLFPQLTAW